MDQCIRALDQQGMVAILGYFYFGQASRLTDEAAVKAAATNATQWVLNQGYTNVMIEICNETDAPDGSGSAYTHPILQPARVGELISAVQMQSAAAGHRLPVSVSLVGGRIPPDSILAVSDYILLHGNAQTTSTIANMISTVRGKGLNKPIVFNEDSTAIAKLQAAMNGRASWGFLDLGANNYVDGYQSPPTNWGINTAPKQMFFNALNSYLPQFTPTPTPTPAPTPMEILTNGSFEQDYAGWSASGHQEIVSGAASDGTKAVRFNGTQSPADSVLWQSFATTAGKSYLLSFDYGVYSPKADSGALKVTVQGNGSLLSQLLAQSGGSPGIPYQTSRYVFTADADSATLQFTDVSPLSPPVDCYLDHVSGILLVSPTISVQPLSQITQMGSQTTFTVVATGTEPLAYQWQKDGLNVPGATSQTLVIGSTQAGDAGTYTVTVSNLVGAVTSNAATLSVFASSGPLRADPKNRRYFTNNQNAPVFLTGSHVWLDLEDFSLWSRFDYAGYLDFLVSRGHNFVRLWNFNHPYLPVIDCCSKGFVTPLPYLRTGPGTAADGRAKFDLTQFDHSYFDQLRARITAAGARQVYVSVMLFDGSWLNGNDQTGFNYSFYNPANNINSIAATRSDVYTLSNSALVALMDAYVDKVIDTVNDLDNVLYEVADEAPPGSRAWQYHVIDHIHVYESSKPKQHPVGMTAYDFTATDQSSNTDMLASSADWISLSGRSDANYKTAIPDAPATKVSVLDTDHIWGIAPATDDSPWVWKSLLRGHNPIYLDPYGLGTQPPPDLALRSAMTYAAGLVSRMGFEAMTPADSLSSTGYALGNSGIEYLIYQPNNAVFTANFPVMTFNYEWINPATGQVTQTGRITTRAGSNSFTPPSGYTNGALLHLLVAPSQTPTPSPSTTPTAGPSPSSTATPTPTPTQTPTATPTPAGQFVSSFTLINADTDQPIQTLNNGATVNLATLPTKNLNIQANTSPTTVGSVVLVLSGRQSRNQTETTPPYALFGDTSGHYAPWTPATGSYTLKATPFSGSSGSGTAGTALTISFTVTNQAPTPTPTATPTPPPTATPAPTATPTPTPSPTSTPTPTATPTATPAATPTPTASPVPTATPTPIDTPTPTPTSTATPTPLATATATPTATPSATPTPSVSPTPVPTPTPIPPGSVITNGSFESGYTGWTATGNQGVATAFTSPAPALTVLDGTHAVQFNAGQRTPNGVLSQTFATVPGTVYRLSFDVGAYGWQTNLEERMNVVVQGSGLTLLSQTVSVFGQGTGTWWTSKTYTFTANASSTTLTFTDVSPNTTNTDLLLDNVKAVPASATPTPSPTSTPSPTATPTPTPAATPTPTPTPPPAGLTNGSFEQNFTGWTSSGNLDIMTGSSNASQGTKALRFNAAQKTPNGVLSQQFTTSRGQKYTLSFDYGIFSPVRSSQQRLKVRLQGNATLLSQTVTKTAWTSTVQYSPNSFQFTADSSLTTLTFTDVSTVTDSVDSYLDNVQVR
jgi:hypothetical protein